MSTYSLGPEWNISPEGVNIITENGNLKDPKLILKKALDADLKLIGKPSLAGELSKSELGKIVLQIQKIKNISAPKAKENSQVAPRMLKLTLTDGESYAQAIEIIPISNISREKTAPGTKVLINGAKITSGYVLIDPKNFSVLGGQVENLYDKWVLAKSVQQSHQNQVSTGAPPWVPFGCKIISENQEKGFKSLDKDTNVSGESEFDQQRKEAIAEASSGAVKKSFGGRVRQNVQQVQNTQQHNKGRTNDQDRGRRGKFTKRSDELEEKRQKPSEKVSLFSFLEDKLPATSSSNSNDYSYHQKDPKMNANGTKQINKSIGVKNDNGDSIRDFRNNRALKFAHNEKKESTEKANTGGSGSEFRRSQQKYSQPYADIRSKESLNYQKDLWKSDHKAYNNKYPSQNQGKYHQQQRNDSSRYQQGPQPKSNFTPQQFNSLPQNINIQNNPLEMHQLANDLSKMSVSNDFASRSLRQHLNLGPPKKSEGTGKLNVGDQCLAKYWEDGKFYPATISAVTEKTYAVQFKGYGNIEEVLKCDCFVGNVPYGQQQKPYYEQNNFSGNSLEFRSKRGPPRN
ncbi:tudor domain-containing protein 3-like [Euwallacea similis]|uniref:tudor domain-containing protein 3-like n=1 Tax=Euwallacea similis TaxID=1736056 RepID=UPI00344E831A